VEMNDWAFIKLDTVALHIISDSVAHEALTRANLIVKVISQSAKESCPSIPQYRSKYHFIQETVNSSSVTLLYTFSLQFKQGGSMAPQQSNY